MAAGCPCCGGVECVRPVQSPRWCPRCQGAKPPTAPICQACSITRRWRQDKET